MEPFVPEADERIGQRNSNAAKPAPKSTANKNNRTSSSAASSAAAAPQMKLMLVMAAVFLVLLIVVYALQQSSISQLKDQLAALPAGGIASSAPSTAVASNDNAPTLAKQVTALSKLVDSQVIALHELRNQLKSGTATASTSKAAAPADNALQGKINTLQQTLKTLSAKLGAQEKGLNQLQTTVANQPTAIAASGSTNSAATQQLNALKSQVNKQTAALNNLKSKDGQLAQQLQASKTAVQKLQASLTAIRQAPKPTAGAGAGADTSGLHIELTNLNTKAENTLARVRANEAELSNWKRRVDTQLASRAVTSGAGGLSAADRAIIQALKKQHPYADFPK